VRRDPGLEFQISRLLKVAQGTPRIGHAFHGYRVSDNVFGPGMIGKGAPRSKAYKPYVVEGERLIAQSKNFIWKTIEASWS
jgi:hypothetical protein